MDFLELVGIILVPFLSIFRIKFNRSFRISLFCIIGTSLSVSARKMRLNQIRLDLAMKVESTALFFGFVGGLLAFTLPIKVVQICFAIMVSLLAVLMMKKKNKGEKGMRLMVS